MSNKTKFNKLSYEQHASVFGVTARKHLKRIFDETTLGTWRHNRLCRFLNPIIECEPEARWLTIGDGRWGKDAWYIQKQGCDVLATDISDARLKEACEHGFIKKYKRENAESLSFDDESFDYALCKASYHHFPRPMIALYEMLRVSSRGVVLIEPVDRYITGNILEVLFRFVTNDLFRIEKRHRFEKVAKNYVYSLSEREIEKVALGMNYPVIAFRGVNLSGLKDGVSLEVYDKKSKSYKKFKRKMMLLDLLAWLKLRKHGKLVAIVFKISPPASLLTDLKGKKFIVKRLPNNPHF